MSGSLFLFLHSLLTGYLDLGCLGGGGNSGLIPVWACGVLYYLGDETVHAWRQVFHEKGARNPETFSFLRK